MLVAHDEVLILDCIYKTNRYKMSLAILTGVTGLNTSYYAGKCFMKDETETDYNWLMSTIKDLYKKLNISLSKVWISDDEINIEKVIASQISPHAVHMLCIWHIEQNVLNNCRKHFQGQSDRWIEFYEDKKAKPDPVRGDFQSLLNATKEKNLNRIWQIIKNKYSDLNESAVIDYLTIYIMFKKKK